MEVAQFLLVLKSEGTQNSCILQTNSSPPQEYVHKTNMTAAT